MELTHQKQRCSHTLTLFVFLSIVIALSICFSGCISENTDVSEKSPPTLEHLTLYTEHLPPYNYLENGTVKGFTVDLLEAISAKMGKKMNREDIIVAPWEEGYHEVVQGGNSMIFATVRIPSREDLFKWAGPISVERDVLFAHPDQNIRIHTLGDLHGLRIGVTPDHAGTQQLLDSGVGEEQLVRGGNASTLIGMLDRKEIDLFCYPEMTGRYLAEQVTGDYYAFDVVFPLEEVGLYYAFSRDVPDSLVQSVQDALDTLKEEKDAKGISTYDRIHGWYIPSLGLSHLEYLTEEWPPFNYMDGGVPSGISVDILESVFQSLGVNRTRTDVLIVPLSEAFEQVRGNTSTVLFSIVKSPEREPLYQWAGPFTKGRFVIFAPVFKNVTITSPEDLNRYRIGAVKGTIENTLLANIGILPSQIVHGLQPADLVRMLKRGEIDLWSTGDITGRYEMKTAGMNPDDYEIVYTLGENDFYFIFSRDVPESLVRAFEKGLERIRNKKDDQGISEYERILYRNTGVCCSEQLFSASFIRGLIER